MVAAIGWDEVFAWRMGRQFLRGAGASSVEEVVGRLVAVQSWSGDAELAVGSRMRHPRSGAVAEAFTHGKIVKTFAFRGSMNFLVPEDAGAYLSLRAARRQWELKSWRDFYCLEPDDWPVVRAVVRDALSSGPLTQKQLADAVVREPRFAHLDKAFTDKSLTFLKPFAWQGDLILGPSRDGVMMLQSPTFVSGWSGIPELDDAGTLAVRAYLSAYGPASAEHLQYWLGDGLSAGRKRIAGWIDRMLGDEIVTIDVEGNSLLCLAEYVDELVSEPSSGVVRLLPGLDPWVLGVGTADPHIVPADRRTEITRGGNLVLVDGRVAGTWKIVKDLLTVASFDGTLPRDDLDTERGRLAEMLGRDIDLDGP